VLEPPDAVTRLEPFGKRTCPELEENVEVADTRRREAREPLGQRRRGASREPASVAAQRERRRGARARRLVPGDDSDDVCDLLELLEARQVPALGRVGGEEQPDPGPRGRYFRVFVNVQLRTSPGATVTLRLVPLPDAPATPFSVHEIVAVYLERVVLVPGVAVSLTL
jgi:hypothetical protein